MSANSVYCHVLKGTVTVVSDLNGRVTNIVCPKFWRLTHGCAIKRENSSVLGVLLKRHKDIAFGTRDNMCEFAEDDASPAAKLGKKLRGEDSE
jgi:hypothetical protein